MNKLGYSIEEIAEILGVSRCTIYQELNAGNLDSIKIQGRRIITSDQIERYLKSKQEAAGAGSK